MYFAGDSVSKVHDHRRHKLGFSSDPLIAGKKMRKLILKTIHL